MEIGFAPENHHTFLNAFIKLRHTIDTNDTKVKGARKREHFPTKMTLQRISKDSSISPYPGADHLTRYNNSACIYIIF